jgi:hypothetical protein
VTVTGRGVTLPGSHKAVESRFLEVTRPWSHASRKSQRMLHVTLTSRFPEVTAHVACYRDVTLPGSRPWCHASRKSQPMLPVTVTSRYPEVTAHAACYRDRPWSHASRKSQRILLLNGRALTSPSIITPLDLRRRKMDPKNLSGKNGSKDKSHSR